MTMSRNSPGLLLAPVILVVILASTVACSSSSPDDAPGNNGGPGTSPSHCLTAPDPVVLRNELVAGQPTASPRLLLRFAQMTDDHIMDEDGAAVNGGSPLDPLHPVFEAAQRFQDEYTDEVLNAMVKTINGCHAAAPVAFVVATGDNTDLGTVAEVRRFIDNLDGDFDRISDFEKKCAAGLPAGTPAQFVDQQCTRFTGRGIADTQTVDPDIDDPSYQFLPTRMLRQLFDTEEAVFSGRAADGSTDPSRSTANRAPGMPQVLRCKAGEAGCANLRLAAPYYAAFGNHDGYVRGTLVTEPGLQEASTPFGRHYMRMQHEFIDEFFETATLPGPVGHGFNFVEPARLNDGDGRNDGYYAFNAGGGRFRMIVMNTIIDGSDPRLPEQLREIRNPFGLADGTLDAAQFEWIKAELAQAHDRGQLVLVFSHHPDLTFAEYGTFAPFLPSEPAFVSAATLDAELASYPNLVAWVAGHTHRHRIRAFKVENGKGHIAGRPEDEVFDVGCKEAPASRCSGFWQIETASLIDFPQEQRLLEILDNANGTGTIRARVLQHDIENAKRLAERDDLCQFYLSDPAAVQQAISDADISAICKQGGTRDGEPTDRNVDLMFRMP